MRSATTRSSPSTAPAGRGPRGRTGAVARAVSAFAAVLATAAGAPALAADVTWLGGSGNWSSASWSTGLFASGGPHRAFIDGGNSVVSTVALDVNVTLAGLEISSGDTLNVLNGRVLGFTGTSLVNQGTLNISGAGDFTYLDMQADLTLSGGGQTVLGDQVRNGISGGGHLLTVAAGHTLRGGGSIGGNGYNGPSGIVNRGQIVVDAATYGMTIQSGTLQNFGSVTVTSGSTLWLQGTVLSGGTVSGSGTAALGGGGTFADTAFSGSLRLVDNQFVRLSGTVQNQGTLSVAGVGNFTYLDLAADTTLSGSGTLVLGDHYRNGISGSNHVLTIAAGQTVSGGGSIGGNGYSTLAGIVNLGTLRVNAPVYGMHVETAGGTLANTGRVEVTGGSTLYLVNTTLSGGTVAGVASGSAGLAGGGTFTATTFSGSLALQDNQFIRLSGAVQNQGTLTIAGAGNFTYLELAANTTLSGSGTLVLGDQFRNGISGSGKTLTIASGQTLSGGGSIGGNGYGTLAAIVNAGTLRADAPLYGMHIETANGSLANSGRVEIANATTLALVSTALSGGVVNGTGSAALAGGGSLNNTSLTGRLQVADGQTIGLGGAIANQSTLTVAGVGSFSYLRLAADTTLSGSGQVVLGDQFRNGISGDGHALTIGAGQTLSGGGTIGGNGLGTASSVTNLGLIAVNAPVYGMHIEAADGLLHNLAKVTIATGSTLSVAGQFMQGTGGLLQVDGVLSAQRLLLDGGTLQGTGTVSGDVLAGASFITPGDSVGKLTIAGALTLSSASRLVIEADGRVQGSGYDWLFVTGNSALAGALALDIRYGAQVGDSFVVLSSDTGTLSGTFSSISATGYTLATSYGLHSVTVTVLTTPVPEPAGYALFAAGLLALALRRHAGERLQA